jgi:GNAT superfamily N-acetyltransferase
MNNRVSTRPATPADVPLILALIRELAAYERLEHLVSAKEEDLRQALFGERPFAEALIGNLDDEPAGFALFFPNFSTFLGKPGLYLEDLYVRPDARGAGLGRMLLAHLARVAVERGWGRMEWAVLDWNTPAIGFYSKMGAIPLDDWTTFRVTGVGLRKLAMVYSIQPPPTTSSPL